MFVAQPHQSVASEQLRQRRATIGEVHTVWHAERNRVWESMFSSPVRKAIAANTPGVFVVGATRPVQGDSVSSVSRDVQ